MRFSLQRRIRSRFVTFFAAALLVASATVVPLNPAQAAEGEVTVESVEVTILKGETLTRELAVSPEGAQIQLITFPQHGDMSITGWPPTLSYTPNPDFVGTESFYYDAQHEGVFSELGLITIHVVDPAPIVSDQTYSTHHSTPVTGNVLTGASDPAGKNLSAWLEVAPMWGYLILNADGSFVYTAYPFTPSTFTGSDSFQFTARNDTETSRVGTVTIELTDTAPTADDIRVSGPFDEPVTESLSGSDPDGDPLTFELSTDPSSGAVALDGTDFTYTPDAGFSGDDSFTYIVHDGALESEPATVQVAIAPPVNLAPVAQAGTATGISGTPITGVLSGTDLEGAPLAYAIAEGPADGAVEVDASTGEFTYTSDPGFVGDDAFTFTVSDGEHVSTPATVVITVEPIPNQPPLVEDGTVTGTMDTDIVGTFTGSDPDGDDLTYDVSTAPEHGSVTIDGTTFTYTPDAGFTGRDSFQFTADDGEATSAPGTIDITVNPPPNTPPVAHDGTVSGDEGTAITGTLAGSDDDGDALTYAIAQQPASGTVTLDGAVFTYTPNAGFTGDDAFTFAVSDGQFTSEPATVTITVNAVEVPPTPPVPPTTTPTPPTTPPTDLAVTGADPTLPIVIGAGLLLLGAVVLLLRRRGRRSGDSEEH